MNCYLLCLSFAVPFALNFDTVLCLRSHILSAASLTCSHRHSSCIFPALICVLSSALSLITKPYNFQNYTHFCVYFQHTSWASRANSRIWNCVKVRSCCCCVCCFALCVCLLFLVVVLLLCCCLICSVALAGDDEFTQTHCASLNVVTSGLCCVFVCWLFCIVCSLLAFVYWIVLFVFGSVVCVCVVWSCVQNPTLICGPFAKTWSRSLSTSSCSLTCHSHTHTTHTRSLCLSTIFNYSTNNTTILKHALCPRLCLRFRLILMANTHRRTNTQSKHTRKQQ